MLFEDLDPTYSNNDLNGQFDTHDTIGSHVIVELSGCKFESLNDPDLIKTILVDAIEMSGANIIDYRQHQFPVQGVSFIFLLSESHLSIHTWPEHGYASIDMYTCGRSNPLSACNYIKEKFNASKIIVSQLKRGIAIKSNDDIYFTHKIIPLNDKSHLNNIEVPPDRGGDNRCF